MGPGSGGTELPSSSACSLKQRVSRFGRQRPIGSRWANQGRLSATCPAGPQGSRDLEAEHRVQKGGGGRKEGQKTGFDRRKREKKGKKERRQSGGNKERRKTDEEEGREAEREERERDGCRQEEGQRK